MTVLVGFAKKCWPLSYQLFGTGETTCIYNFPQGVKPCQIFFIIDRSPSNFYEKAGKSLVKRYSYFLATTSYRDTRWSSKRMLTPYVEAVERMNEETSHHVVAECHALATIRLRVLGTPVLQGTLHWSTQIAKFLLEIISALCKINE